MVASSHLPRPGPVSSRTTSSRLRTLLYGISSLLLLTLVQAQGPQTVLQPSEPNTIDNNDSNRCTSLNEGLAKKAEIVGKNWIVVTTINPPTDAMNLLCNLPEWNIVVIADTKSPKEWKCGACVYLTVEEQQCLGFSIVPVTPFKAYTRKNIGYLWAIKQGATTVFDTDDDNLPMTREITFEPSTESFIVFSNATTSRSVNIYSHFGRPDVWPRGFPLSQIDIHQQPSYLPSFGMLPDKHREVVGPPALIQQGLADLDPDVDAIFRLTQGQELKRIKYCQESPSIRLAPGTFCPFNSQNTLFSYDALWGLVLPISVSFRVCDIWRGYWVQRLLWDVNGSLAFTRPTVEQIRNAHNYLDDFKDEIQLYTDTSRFIDFLANWTSVSTDLETRIVELMTAMAAEKFIGKADVDLAQRWVKDLQSVGYVFPKVTAYDSEAVQRVLQAYSTNQSTMDTHILSNNALGTCQNADPSSSKIQTLDQVPSFDAFKDVLLIVNFNTGDYYDPVIDLYLEIYRPYFPNIVFYGDSNSRVPERFQNVVKTVDSDRGVFAYLCLIDAMETHPGYKGYLYTNDDVILNVHQLVTFDQNKVWKSIPRIPLDVHPRLEQSPDRWSLWGWDSSKMWNDSSLFTPEQRERIANFTGNKGATDVRAWVDAIYIPGRLAAEFTPIIHNLHQYRVHNELVIGVTLLGIEPVENWIPWHEEYLWNDSGPPERLRDHWREWLKPGVAMLHSVKLSGGSAVKDDIKHWVDTVEAVTPIYPHAGYGPY